MTEFISLCLFIKGGACLLYAYFSGNTSGLFINILETIIGIVAFGKCMDNMDKKRILQEKTEIRYIEMANQFRLENPTAPFTPHIDEIITYQLKTLYFPQEAIQTAIEKHSESAEMQFLRKKQQEEKEKEEQKRLKKIVRDKETAEKAKQAGEKEKKYICPYCGRTTTRPGYCGSDCSIRANGGYGWD